MPDGKFPLPLVQAPPRELLPRPSEVVFSEPMLRYQCNLKGCCCSGWTIPFQLDDFVRLYRALPEGEREKLGRGMEVIVAPVDAPPPEEDDVSGWTDPNPGGEHATKAAHVGAVETGAMRALINDPELLQPALAAAARTLVPPAPVRNEPPVPAPAADEPPALAPAMDRPGPATSAGQASHVLQSIRLSGVGEDDHCRFLQDDKGCRVHAGAGLWALPDICVNFPAFGYRVPEQSAVEIWWDPICPEVLHQLDEADTPLEMHRAGAASPAWSDPAFEIRVSNALHSLHTHVHGVPVSRDELEHIRAECLRALGDQGRPAWRSLAAIICAFQKLQPGKGLDFRAEEPKDQVPFLAFLGGCVGAHGAPILAWALQNYRRFVHAADISKVFDEPPEVFNAALEAWGKNIDTYVGKREETLRPLMLRWMGHRFGMPYVNQTGDLRACADTIAMIYGCSLRIAGALGAVLGREVDRALYQVALGTAEYFYRSLVFRRESLPWFASVENYQAALLRVTSI